MEREAEAECAPSSSSVHHKRSKSASGRNLDVTKNATLYCMEKDRNKSKNMLDTVSSCGAKGSRNYLSSNNTDIASLDPRASLECEIKQLQMHLHQEKSVRVMLERAIGRASSTLSPGHRHLATQTKELISEIELLEEEIADREQHVLSLYRSIFEQCISAPSSAQSSGMASPAHPKNIVRKQPSIISTAFCSSKKFPLKTFNVLASIKESGRSNSSTNTKVRNGTLLTGDTNFNIERNSSEIMKKFPNVRRNYLALTLKEHLYQCPSKLSEELVRCMATIYCWVGSKEYAEPQKTHSPFLSRSSTSVVLPRRGAEEQWELSCSSWVVVHSISMDKNHFSSASCAINHYRLLVEQLERVDADTLGSSVKLAFWINVYNSLVMHAYLKWGIFHSSIRRIALFHKAAYNVGGHTISASSIENSILCCRTPRPGRWFESILSTAMRKKYGDEKNLTNSKFGLSTSQPLILFALCSGAASDPMLRVYTAENVLEELEKAKKEFLQANVVIKKSRKIYLPRILERYAKEASLSSDDLLTWVSKNIEKKVDESIQKCFASNNRRKASQVVEWLPYNTRFRYVFQRNLAQRPRWV